MKILFYNMDNQRIEEKDGEYFVFNKKDDKSIFIIKNHHCKVYGLSVRKLSEGSEVAVGRIDRNIHGIMQAPIVDLEPSVCQTDFTEDERNLTALYFKNDENFDSSSSDFVINFLNMEDNRTYVVLLQYSNYIGYDNRSKTFKVYT